MCSIWKGPSVCVDLLCCFVSFWVLHSSGFRNYVEFSGFIVYNCAIYLGVGGGTKQNTHILKYLYQKQVFRVGSSAAGMLKCTAVIASFHFTFNSSERPDHVLGWIPGGRVWVAGCGGLTSEPKDFCLPFSSLLVNIMGPNETAAHRFLSRFFKKKPY